MRILLIVLISVSAFAEEAKAPVISPDLRAQYWRALYEMESTRKSFEAAQKVYEGKVTELMQACGPQFILQGDPKSGEPSCQPKPVPVKEK